jgi:peptidoglycan-N-acetylglucosamine deacetylase
MKRILFAWPEGKAGALTTSWDDGSIHDRPLLDILNRAGLKGTWNLNASTLAASPEADSAKERIVRSDVKSLYAGHEVACHGFTHPFLERIPEEAVLAELFEDRRQLESLAGYPVKGMSLPYGTYDRRVLRLLRACGILHSRTTRAHGAFGLPEDFVEWHPTCHHKQDLSELWSKFQAAREPHKLFYLWGHSYEFNRDHNWDHIQAFASLAGPDPAVWQATNMQICEYVTAWRGLWCALDLSSARNPSATPVWLRVDGELRVCQPGQTLAL